MHSAAWVIVCIWESTKQIPISDHPMREIAWPFSSSFSLWFCGPSGNHDRVGCSYSSWKNSLYLRQHIQAASHILFHYLLCFPHTVFTFTPSGFFLCVFYWLMIAIKDVSGILVISDLSAWDSGGKECPWTARGTPISWMLLEKKNQIKKRRQ